MIDAPAPPPDDTDGVEPQEESGAGYGNHAPDAEGPEKRSGD